MLLVDDHTLLRQGLRNLLELEENIVVVGEVGTGEDAVRKTGELLPDIVLMDITVPGMDGIQATQMIKQDHPEVGVIMLTMHVDDQHVVSSIKAGASGYLVKSVSQEELTKAIEVVFGGGALLYPGITKQVMNRFVHLSEGMHDLKALGLTEREKEVLKELCQGASNKEIARKLFVSEKTVKSHLSAILRKLGVSDRTQAVARALREGLIE